MTVPCKRFEWHSMLVKFEPWLESSECSIKPVTPQGEGFWDDTAAAISSSWWQRKRLKCNAQFGFMFFQDKIWQDVFEDLSSSMLSGGPQPRFVHLNFRMFFLELSTVGHRSSSNCSVNVTDQSFITHRHPNEKGEVRVHLSRSFNCVNWNVVDVDASFTINDASNVSFLSFSHTTNN